MRRIHIESGPPPRSYDSFEEAISGAERHPLQDKARDAGALLDQAQVDSAGWSTGACEIDFGDSRVLRVAARNFQLEWEVLTTATFTPEPAYQPVELNWSPELQAVFDPYSLVARISGRKFVRLFVNEMGLLLYTQGNPVLWFHALRIRESNQDLLFATFED